MIISNYYSTCFISLFDVQLRVEDRMFELPPECASAESKSPKFSAKSGSRGLGTSIFL